MEVGIDILHIDRFVRLCEHPRVSALLFTRAELRDCAPLHGRRRIEFLAGRYAAKEAVVKALGVGFAQGVHWRDVEIRSDEARRPAPLLHGAARRIAEAAGRHVSVSISHHAGFVVSVAAAWT